MLITVNVKAGSKMVVCPFTVNDITSSKYIPISDSPPELQTDFTFQNHRQSPWIKILSKWVETYFKWLSGPNFDLNINSGVRRASRLSLDAKGQVIGKFLSLCPSVIFNCHSNDCAAAEWAFGVYVHPFDVNIRSLCKVERVSRNLSSDDRGIRGSPDENGLPYENPNSNKGSDDTENRCKHITSVEHVERIILSLLFFALCLWLFYYIAGSSLSAGRYLRFCGACLLGAVCFLTGVEFAYAASNSGVSGWSSIWRSFLCAYTEHDCENGCGSWKSSHTADTVTHEYLLTSPTYWGTVIVIGRANMANVLDKNQQVAVISALAEGSGIRQIERITGVHRDTVMRLGVRVGQGCATMLDRKMRGLSCGHLQFDEVWGFVGKKQRHVRPDDDSQYGDVWTFCAIDSDTKLVPSFKVGRRDSATANAFVSDVASRLRNRVQISSDGLSAYVEAVEQAFGANVDYAQIVKVFQDVPAETEVLRMDKTPYMGRPNMGLASTSHVETLNGTTRLHMRRLTRLTYAFSKKLENFEAAVALHFAYYNFVKRHNTLRCTPAMAAGIERDFWSVGDLVEAAA